MRVQHPLQFKAGVVELRDEQGHDLDLPFEGVGVCHG